MANENYPCDYQPKQTGSYSRTYVVRDGVTYSLRYRPRVIWYEGTWNVTAYARKSVVFENWEDAARFAVCAFEHPEMMRTIF